ncbi:MAG: PLP-dependent aminotransferase family protein [Thermoleophilia bacterium]|nr:PLP-dependent aminotransferase family protein [Thermoleophilia bacterium]
MSTSDVTDNTGTGAPLPPQTPLVGPADAARYDSRFSALASGTTSSVMRDLMAITEKADIISLAGGLPDTDTFPREIFDEISAEIGTDFLASSLQYGPTDGMGDLREQIVAVMADEGARARPDDVLITTGGQQAIDLSFRTFIDRGDPVLAEGPTYPGAAPCLTAYGADVTHIPMDDDGMREDLLEEAYRRLAAEGRPPKILYTIPNFQNPAGVTMSLERRERLVEFAHSVGLLIIEDNPYGQIRFEGDPLPTLYELDDGAGWVVYLGTFSKILAPGIRVGWAVAPPAVLRKMNLGKQAADLCSSTLTQRFVAEYLKRYDYREHVARVTDIYRCRRDAMLEALEARFPAEATWTHPRGGLFVWATLPDYIDTTALQAKALERQVAFVPGEGAFLDGRGKNSMRLNFSGVPEAMITEGIGRLGDVINDFVTLHQALNPGAR